VYRSFLKELSWPRACCPKIICFFSDVPEAAEAINSYYEENL
jgi:hypothetical protein